MSDEKKGFTLFTKSAGGASAPKPAGAPLIPKQKDVRQRWMLVAGGALVLAGVASSLFKEDAPVRTKKEAPVGMVDVTPAASEKRAFEAKFNADLERLKQNVDRMEQDRVKRDEEMQRLRDELAKGAKPGATPELPVNQGAIPPLGAGAPPAPPEPPKLPPRLQSPTVTPPTVTAPPMGGPSTSPSLPPPSAIPSMGRPMEFKGPGDAKDGATPVAAKTTFKRNENVGRIPLAFASISLLNGIDAGTSQATQSNPLPVLISINNHAQLPGLSKYKLKGCFALGTGYGELSAERVYVRISRLSCVDKQNGLVLSQEVGGYVSDSDGTLGLRGKVENRQGARLGNALLAGFAQGLAGALGSAQSTATSSSLTGAVTSSITGSSAMRAAGLSGAQNAADQLAQFYLKEAQNIFPVIAVENGRTGTLVLTSDAKLEWFNNRDQYIGETAPTKQ